MNALIGWCRGKAWRGEFVERRLNDCLGRAGVVNGLRAGDIWRLARCWRVSAGDRGQLLAAAYRDALQDIGNQAVEHRGAANAQRRSITRRGNIRR